LNLTKKLGYQISNYTILELVYFKTLYQFNHSAFEICRFNPFNKIVLSLFDISNVFHNNI